MKGSGGSGGGSADAVGDSITMTATAPVSTHNLVNSMAEAP